MAADTPAEQPCFRMAVVGDFAGEAEAKTARIAIDRQRFDEAMARVAPGLRLRVPNAIAAGAAPLDIELRFESLRDLGPAGVAAQVPLLGGLLEARDLVERSARGEIEPAALRERLDELLPVELAAEVADSSGDASPAAPESGAAARPAAAASTAAPHPGSLDSIMGLVDSKPESGAATPETARRLVDQLTARRGGRARAGRRAVPGAVAAIDRALGAQLDIILHEPGFRALEARWRGLRFLVDRCDFRKGIEVELLSAPVEAAAEAVESLGGGEDVDVVLADYEFDASARDFERVQALGEAGGQIQSPVVTALAPAFFGLESWAELARTRAPYALFDEPGYAAWRSLREDERSRALVLVANRIALRGSFGPDGEKARDIDYREGGADTGLFGSGVFAVGSVLARAFVRSGVCVQISGTRNGLVQDLPLLSVSDGRPSPVEGVFNNERREDLERIGLVAVQLYQRDIAFVGTLRTFRKAGRYSDAEASADAVQHVTLAYQLFATRFVKFLGRLLPELMGLGDPAAASLQIGEAVLAFVSTPQHPLQRDHMAISLTQNADDAALTDVSLRIQPELVIASRPVNVLLNFSLRLV